MSMFSDDFFDNVSGRRGLYIFDVVRVWMEESFADLRVDLVVEHWAVRDDAALLDSVTA
jgi:hypothetical protein